MHLYLVVTCVLTELSSTELESVIEGFVQEMSLFCL